MDGALKETAAWLTHMAGAFAGLWRIRFDARKVSLFSGVNATGFVVGALMAVMGTVLTFFLSHIVLKSLATPEKMKAPPETMYCIGFWATLSLLAVASLGWFMLMNNLPGVLTFDGIAGRLFLRRLFRKTIAWPLADVDGIKLVYDRNGFPFHWLKNYYYSVVFKKQLVRTSIPVSSQAIRPADLRRFRVRVLYAVNSILSDWRGGDTELRRAWAKQPGSFWWPFGRRYYRLYAGGLRRILFMVAGDAAVFLILLGLRRWVAPAILSLFPEVEGLRFDYYWDILFYVAAALVVLDLAFRRVGLRLDAESRIVSLYRGLGLWRTDFPFSRFGCFSLCRPEGKPGLTIEAEGLGEPLWLSHSPDPETLGPLLVETASILGIDPWEHFRPYPREYDPDPLSTC